MRKKNGQWGRRKTGREGQYVKIKRGDYFKKPYGQDEKVRCQQRKTEGFIRFGYKGITA